MMLFILDESLDEIARDSTHVTYAKFVEEVTALARARNAGKLIVFLDSPNIFTHISQASELSVYTKSIFSFLNRQRVFKLDILKSVSVAVRIMAGGDSISAVSVAGRCELRVPISQVPYGLFNSPVLLAENLSDAKAYVIFTRMALAAGATGLPSVGLSAELRGGGGSTIASEYIESKTKGDRLLLCVLDSDVRYPDGPSNAWSQTIKSHDEQQPSMLAASEIIDVYSIENLFPLSSLSKLEPYVNDQNAAFALSKDLPVLNEHAKQPYWRYIRLKNGVSCNDLRDRGELGMFWAKYAHSFNNFSSKKCEIPPDSCRHTCARNPRFRENTLQAFVDRYNNASVFELKELYSDVPKHISEHFDSLARVIASWTCFGKSVSAVAAVGKS